MFVNNGTWIHIPDDKPEFLSFILGLIDYVEPECFVARSGSQYSDFLSGSLNCKVMEDYSDEV